MSKPSLQPEIVKETISPAKAAEFLKANRKNRHLVNNRVNFYARQMEAGQWKLSGDTIKFDTLGNLIDGQHRLEAIVKSGVTVECFIARNVPVEAFDVLDTGRGRQAGDVLSAHGFQNVFSLGSSARLVYFFERKIVPAQPTVSNHEILETVKRHPNLPSLTVDVLSYKFAKSGAVIASLYWLEVCNKSKGEVFTETFLKGLDLKVTNPIYALRERVINDRFLIETRRGRLILCTMFFRTWDAFINGRPATHMVATTPQANNYPWPKGGAYLE